MEQVERSRNHDNDIVLLGRDTLGKLHDSVRGRQELDSALRHLLRRSGRLQARYSARLALARKKRERHGVPGAERVQRTHDDRRAHHVVIPRCQEHAAHDVCRGDACA